MPQRTKLSTTVSAATYRYLQQKVETGEAATIAEAIDILISKIRRIENRQRLASATATYFDELEPRAAAEEDSIARDMTSAAEGIDFDNEL